jgi:proline racemase
LEVPDLGVEVDLAFAGAIYASLPAAALGLSVEGGDLAELIAAAAAIRSDERLRDAARHDDDPRLSGIYGVIFHDGGADEPDWLHQRNVTVFADGEVDRSPCGSGSSARVALLVDEGALELGETLVHESIVGTRFTVTATEKVTTHGRDAFVTEIGGMAYPIAESRFVLDPRDPLAEGFLLAD